MLFDYLLSSDYVAKFDLNSSHFSHELYFLKVTLSEAFLLCLLRKKIREMIFIC